MRIRHLRFILCLLIHILINTTDSELAEYNEVDENDTSIKGYEELNRNRPRPLKLRDDDIRIVGGRESSIEDHPYTVSIQRGQGIHMCGGSIIDEWWVLTASHCITENRCQGTQCKRDVLKDPREFQINAGTSDIHGEGEVREILQFVKHPSFSRPLLHNDIGLIKVKNSFTFGEKVNLIHIPQSSFLKGRDVSESYKSCKALGWGARKPRSGKRYEDLTEQEKLEIRGDLVSPKLMEVDLPVIPIRWCQSLINNLYITSQHMCTMYMPGGKDACEGDSGGPLVCKKDNVTLQYGITSWGHGCALPRTPAAFIRTDTFYDWVQRIMSGGANIDYFSSSNKVVCTKWLLFVAIPI